LSTATRAAIQRGLVLTEQAPQRGPASVRGGCKHPFPQDPTACLGTQPSIRIPLRRSGCTRNELLNAY